MDRIAILGGARLEGEIQISGAKNSALKLMAAALLTDEPLKLVNMPRLADTRFPERLGGPKPAPEGERAAALIGGEVAVPGAHGEPVRLAHRGPPHHLHPQVQVPRERPDDLELLVVLLAEEGDVRHRLKQKLGDDRGDAGEMPGAERRAESVGQTAHADRGCGATAGAALGSHHR